MSVEWVQVGDTHPLSLQQFKGTMILSAGEFLKTVLAENGP